MKKKAITKKNPPKTTERKSFSFGSIKKVKMPVTHEVAAMSSPNVTIASEGTNYCGCCGCC
jgi:hypothetical protein